MLINDLYKKEEKLDQELNNKLIQLDEISGTSKFLKLRESRVKNSNGFENDFYSSINSHRDLKIETQSLNVTQPLNSQTKVF
jgi:hypothetical protein